jgi:serine/threonine protein kinase
MHSGCRISEILDAGPLATDPLLGVGTALADLVTTEHARAGAIGPMTPANVFVTDTGSVRLLDAARAPVSARREDDLWALGTLLYCLATGTTPYRAWLAPGHGAPPSPIELNPRLPSGLVRLIQRGVHPDERERFRSAAEVRDALREVRRAPGSLESLLPTEHVSSSAAVKLPPRPPADERDEYEKQEDEAEQLEKLDADGPARARKFPFAE